MRYNVYVSDLAYEQYDKFLDYIYHTLLNPQAADSLMQDFDATISILEVQVESFGYCKSEHLRNQGFHKIHFKRHRYLNLNRLRRSWMTGRWYHRPWRIWLRFCREKN